MGKRNYRVLVAGNIAGAAELTPCLPEHEAYEYRDLHLEHGLLAIAFEVDREGRPLVKRQPAH